MKAGGGSGISDEFPKTPLTMDDETSLDTPEPPAGVSAPPLATPTPAAAVPLTQAEAMDYLRSGAQLVGVAKRGGQGYVRLVDGTLHPVQAAAFKRIFKGEPLKIVGSVDNPAGVIYELNVPVPASEATPAEISVELGYADKVPNSILLSDAEGMAYLRDGAELMGNGYIRLTDGSLHRVEKAALKRIFREEALKIVVSTSVPADVIYMLDGAPVKGYTLRFWYSDSQRWHGGNNIVYASEYEAEENARKLRLGEKAQIYLNGQLLKELDYSAPVFLSDYQPLRTRKQVPTGFELTELRREVLALVGAGVVKVDSADYRDGIQRRKIARALADNGLLAEGSGHANHRQHWWKLTEAGLKLVRQDADLQRRIIENMKYYDY